VYAYGRQGAVTYEKSVNSLTGDTLERTYAYLADQVVGWTEKKSENGAVTVVDYYAITDQLGSVTCITDKDAKTLWASEYLPFGNVAGAIGSVPFNGFYTGKDVDSETGLTYHWNRWRSEDGSTFISEDPARDGLNWYGYCGNNPMNSLDPTGLYSWNQFKADVKSFFSGNSGGLGGSGSPEDSGKTSSGGQDEVLRSIEKLRAYSEALIKDTSKKQAPPCGNTAEEQMSYLRKMVNAGENMTDKEKGQLASDLRSLRGVLQLKDLFQKDEEFMNIQLRDFLNLNKNGTNEYDSSELTDANGWSEMSSIGSQYHQTKAGSDLNAKYVNQDGREVVISRSGKVITTYPDKGIFNYVNGTISSSILLGGHKLYDMDPYERMNLQPVLRSHSLISGGAIRGNSSYW
jgi:RHS repeat-associated protein